MADQDNDDDTLAAWESWKLASFDAPAPKRNAAAKPDASVGDELEHLRQQAEQAGRQAGHTAGYAAGYAEGQAKAQTEATRFASMAAQLDAALNEFDLRVSDDLLALALEVARQVVRQSIAVKPELLLETIRQALAQMPHPHTTITIHPEDASLVRSYLGDQLAHAGHRLHEDPRIQRGGCLVEAAGTQIDASIETRWRRIVESLGSNAEWLDTSPHARADEDKDAAAP